MEDLQAEMLADASAPPAGAPTLEAMQALAAEVNDIDERIAKNEERLKELKGRREAIISSELPEMMDRAHISKLEVDGRTFRVEQYCKASIPEQHREVAHNWLEEHDAGDLIDNTVIAAFPKDCQEEAKKLEDYIRQHFQMAEVERKRMVPWARLTSWFKELYLSPDMNKVMPPLDIMGATALRRVKVKKDW